MSFSPLRTSTSDTLYYDGQCPLCSAEICKLTSHTKNTLIIQDIHQLEETPDGSAMPDKSELLSRLHLRTKEGEWLIGIDANIRAWKNTPYGSLWKVLGWPGIRIFTTTAYEIWLRLRK